jgi:DNA invertase Pin-like site-specific DNA recombinase
MLGVFAEFEREMIRERIMAGHARAKAQGRQLGRRRQDAPTLVAEVKQLRSEGWGVLKVARTLGVGTSKVQRIVRELNR